MVKGTEAFDPVSQLPENISKAISYIEQRADQIAIKKLDEFTKNPSFSDGIVKVVNTSPDVISVNGKIVSKAQYYKGLAMDPDKGNLINSKTIDELCIGLSAERQGLLKGPLMRHATGGDFQCASNTAWDVKAGISRTAAGKQIFNAESAKHLIDIMKDDIVAGEKILLDLTKLDSTDLPLLMRTIKEHIPESDFDKIFVFFLTK